MQKVKTDVRSIYSNFVIKLRDVQTWRRDLLLHGIDVDTFPHHDCSDLFGNSHSFHVAQRAVNELVSLPLYYDLSTSDGSYIAKTLMHINKG